MHCLQRAVSRKRGCMPEDSFVQICKFAPRINGSEPPPSPSRPPVVRQSRTEHRILARAEKWKNIKIPYVLTNCPAHTCKSPYPQHSLLLIRWISVYILYSYNIVVMRNIPPKIMRFCQISPCFLLIYPLKSVVFFQILTHQLTPQLNFSLFCLVVFWHKKTAFLGGVLAPFSNGV